LKLKDELLRRFGVTKNINNEIYDIKIEVSYNLARFIESHHWHSTQKTTKRKSNLIIHFKCGINRELLGWLCQWMYNVRVIEPDILKTYYEKTIKEIQINNNSKLPLVYRNIFINNQ
jgi:predicted DNA-binding transcriptional regulator YafY